MIFDVKFQVVGHFPRGKNIDIDDAWIKILVQNYWISKTKPFSDVQVMFVQG